MAGASSALPAFIAALVDSEISAYELQESDAIKALLHCLHATSPAARTSIRTAPVGHEQRQMLFLNELLLEYLLQVERDRHHNLKLCYG